MVTINRQTYVVIEEKRDGFDEEALIARYSDILDKYDYIVGDWGHGQLRLKGFYDDHSKLATFDNRISHVQDYLYEYCNFGSPYFILRKADASEKGAGDAFDEAQKQPLKLKRKFPKGATVEKAAPPSGK